MKKIFRSINESDFFAYSASLRIGSRGTSSTVFGQFLTKIILIAIIILFISEIIASAQKKTPKILYDHPKTFDHPSINLTPKNFKFAFQLLDKNANSVFSNEFSILDYFYFNFSVSRKKVTGFTEENKKIWNINRINVNISSCHRENFMGLESEFDNRHLNEFLCTDDFDAELRGFIDEDECDFIQFDIFKCQNTSLNQNCKSIEDINKKIKNSYIYIYFQEAFPNLSDFENPIVQTLKLETLSLSSNFFKSKKDYLKKNILLTDNSLLPISDISKEVYFEYDYTDLDFSEINDDNKIFKYQLFSSDKETIIFRSYKKIETIISFLGGIANFLFIIGFFLSIKINRHKFVTKLANNLFNFDQSKILHKMNPINFDISENDHKSLISEIPHEKDINIPNEKDMNIKIETIRLKNGLIENSPNVKEIKEEVKLKNIVTSNIDIESVHDVKENKNANNYISVEKKTYFKDFEELNLKNPFDKMSYSLFDYIILHLPFKKHPIENNKRLLYVKSEMKLNKNLDIINILHKLEDVKRLKKLLFNKNQNTAFSFVSKPIIKLVDKDKKQLNKELKLENMIDYFYSKKKEGFKNNIDEKLFNDLDENIKILINKMKN